MNIYPQESMSTLIVITEELVPAVPACKSLLAFCGERFPCLSLYTTTLLWHLPSLCSLYFCILGINPAFFIPFFQVCEVKI